MITQLFSTRYLPHYSESPVADWLIRFSDWLVISGYGRSSAQGHVRTLKKVLENSTCKSATAKFSTTELQVMFKAPAKQEVSYQATQKTFQKFLVTQDQLIIKQTTSPFSLVLDRYQQYLLEIRGLTQATIDQHLSTIMCLLEQKVTSGNSLRTLNQQDVEQFLYSEGERVKRQTLQHIVARIRAFLRYCYDCDVIEERLDIIDTVITYRDELPPRALSWNQVQRLLRSIDRSKKSGWRDYTILHLMAHYGLRPSEVVSLTLNSIDWQAKTLSVDQSKSSSLLILPLSDQTVRVLKRYLYWGRSGSSHHPELFLRARSPSGPLKYTAICDIYEKRARKSGLRLQGTSSYCLRHSFAMRLLNQGVGVKAIGDLLGHRTLESTCVYLRLHIAALKDVALPVPALSEEKGGRKS